MVELKKPEKKPLVGFSPGFFGIGETYPLIKIAKCYQNLGGEVVFFSHGGQYEYLARDLGYEVIRIKPTEYVVKYPNKYFLQRSDSDIIRIIKNVASSYNDAGIKALVQSYIFFGCVFATRVARIPLISVVSGTLAPLYYEANRATYPDSGENYLTLLIPRHIKNRFFNWFIPNKGGMLTKKLNRIAEKLDVDVRFKCDVDLMLGDHTLICDDMEFLGVKPTKEFPLENYVGPILPDDWYISGEKKLDFDIERHLKRPGRHILLTMGSSFKWKEIFLKILKILNETECNFIATYTTILNETELPNLNDNILLKKFIPNITSLNNRIDLAIIHGGRGTVYTAAYSGKPAIGIPMHYEQQYNLDNLVCNGSAIRISKKFFKERDLLNAVEKIFNNYDFYLHNAQNLANKLPKPEGAERAAQRIVEILEKEGLT